MTFSAYPLLSSGSWWTPYKDFVLFAKQLFEEFAQQLDVLDEEETRIRIKKQTLNVTTDTIEDLVYLDTSSRHDLAYRTAISCHIYCCMAIEGFVNMYGVRRLGNL